MNAQQKDRALARRIVDAIDGVPGRLHIPEKGYTAARTLRRAQMTLHRWSEEMCNGTIQREGADGEGRPFRVYPEPILIRGKVFYREPLRDNIPDREAGALRRVAEVCKAAGLHYFYQRDPRGRALFVASFPLDHSNYDRGIACL